MGHQSASGIIARTASAVGAEGRPSSVVKPLP